MSGRASCAGRLGRSPKPHGKKSASKTGSSTILLAVCTTWSQTERFDNGLNQPTTDSGSSPWRRERPIPPLPQFRSRRTQSRPEGPGTSQGGPVDAGSGVVPVHF